MKCSKLIAVLLLGVMMFGTIQPACAETTGDIIGGLVAMGLDLFAETIATVCYGDPSIASTLRFASDGVGAGVGECVDKLISWIFE